jgi:flavodoxin/NAD-dependent dihydropyrimidine dehydrogenase PreA subunit
MKSIVIYHSMTGNTKKIAEGIHRGMEKSGGKCDLVKLKEVRPGDLDKYDLIGIGSPIINQRELYNVSNFIEFGMPHVDGKQAFAFCTHGALPGKYLPRVTARLRQRGLTIIGWKDWFCGVFYPGCPQPYFTDGHPDDIDIKEAEDFGSEMLDRSRRIYAGDSSLIPEFPRGDKYDEEYDPDPMPPADVMKGFRIAQARTLEFKVNKEKCKYPKCRICVDNCPMNNIDFSGETPLFGINCDKCYLCEQACPNGAIEVDWKPFHDAHFPMIQHLQRSLDIFEARGKFRRLVPNDKIGWDNFFWTKKHPRIKIV